MTAKAGGNTQDQLLAGGQWTNELMLEHGLMIENGPTVGNNYLQPQVLPS
jgi:hypothetical protein